MIGGMSVAAKTERDPASCYETPQWLVERIRGAFGGVIDLDPCTTPANPTGANRFYTPHDDGIWSPWTQYGDKRPPRIYVNPPYGRTIRHWTEKALGAQYDGAKVILLVPSRTDSEWFHNLVVGNTVVFMKGRISFRGQENGAKFPSALVGLNHDLAELADLGWRVQTMQAMKRGER